MTTIENVKEFEVTQKKDRKTLIWENLQLIGLALTIVGQITVGAWFLVGQGLWFVSNIIAVSRDFVLKRPAADKIKNITLTGITAGLIILNIFGGMF